jgi:hypothetical protein
MCKKVEIMEIWILSNKDLASNFALNTVSGFVVSFLLMNLFHSPDIAAV